MSLEQPVPFGPIELFRPSSRISVSRLRNLAAYAVAVSIAAACICGAAAQSLQDACLRGGDDASLAACNSAISGSPNNPNAAPFYAARGTKLNQRREYDKAISDFTQAIKLAPEFSRAYNERGLAWKNKGDIDKAIADYSDAIRLDPKGAVQYYNRGVAWRSKGDNDKALADYNIAARLAPTNPRPYNNRGAVWASKGEYEKALADLNEALRLDPSNAVTYFNRGVVFEQTSKLQQALRDFRKFSELASGDPAGPASVKRVADRLDRTKSRLEQDGANQPPHSNGDVRVALIIGNSSYKSVAALRNPGNDAELMAENLRKVGFQTVTIKTNATRDQILQALRDFAVIADAADWAVVYYSGHGMEIGGINYIIPVDAQLRSDRDVDFETVDVGRVLSSIEGAKRLRLLILDACRDNPFANQMRQTSATRSMGRGLARIEPEAGTMIVYAAKHGETALDGDGQNSPFIEALVKRMNQRPSQEVRRLFDSIRDDVIEKTRKQQQPFSYGSLSSREDFYFQ